MKSRIPRISGRISNQFKDKSKRFDSVEQLARIFALLAVPILVATVGAMIQYSVSEDSINKDYVNLAIGILSQQEIDDRNQLLRTWAVEVVNEYSKVKFDEGLKKGLKEGSIMFAYQRYAKASRDNQIIYLMMTLNLLEQEFEYDLMSDASGKVMLEEIGDSMDQRLDIFKMEIIRGMEIFPEDRQQLALNMEILESIRFETLRDLRHVDETVDIELLIKNTKAGLRDAIDRLRKLEPKVER